jgi:hypothetical protein
MLRSALQSFGVSQVGLAGSRVVFVIYGMHLSLHRINSTKNYMGNMTGLSCRLASNNHHILLHAFVILRNPSRMTGPAERNLLLWYRLIMPHILLGVKKCPSLILPSLKMHRLQVHAAPHPSSSGVWCNVTTVLQNLSFKLANF